MKIVKVRIKDIKKFKIFCFVAFFSCMIFFQGRFLYSFNYPNTQYIRVQNGDSLWDIAQKYKVKNDDTRVFIERIKDVNELETSDLVEGQELKIPIANL